MATPGSSHQDKGVDIKVGNLWEALVEPGKEVQPLDAIAQVKHYMNTRSAIRDGIKDYEQVIQKFATSTYILLIPNRPEVADLTAWDKFVAGSRITYPGVRFELWGEVEVYSRLRAVAFSQFSTFLAFLDPASVAFNATFKALHTEVMHLGSPLTQLLQASTKTFFDKQIAHASRSGYSSFVLDPKLPPADRDLLHRTVRRLCQIVNNAQHRM